MRAWIEIERDLLKYPNGTVALFTRAWIEIRLIYRQLTQQLKSPSLRGRGLKYRLINYRYPQLHMSPSLRGRGLKFAEL